MSASGSRSAALAGTKRPAYGVFFPALSTWLRQTLAASLFLALVLFLNSWLDEIEPGNSWSLWYGSVAVFLLVAAALLSVRRRQQALATRWKLGSARAWLDLHIAGGLVFALLVLMHSGFRWPASRLGLILMVLSLWTVVTGIFGLVVQRWLPRVMATGLSVEVLYQRAGELVDDLRIRSRALAEESGPPISTLYSGEVERRFERLQPRWAYLFDITGGQQSVLRGFDHLAERIDESERRALEELRRMLRTKLEIDASYSLQRVLRWWLWLHVPTSLLLIAAVALHVGVSLYY